MSLAYLVVAYTFLRGLLHLNIKDFFSLLFNVGAAVFLLLIFSEGYGFGKILSELVREYWCRGLKAKFL